MLALIHRHEGNHGFLNDGEQEFWVRGGIVRQRNVSTNTSYYHPNITPFWFREDKTWYNDAGFGIAWECHLVCEDTWIVEAVFADRSKLVDGSEDEWKKMFEEADALYNDDVVRPSRVQPVTVLPTTSGKFVELEVSCPELFDALRLQAVGKSRVGSEGRKLYDSLLASAKHLVKPGALFPGADGLACQERLIMDHVLSAFVTDVARETDQLKACALLFPHMASHAKAVRGTAGGGKFSVVGAMDVLRSSVKVGLAVNKVVRASDPIGSALTHLDVALEE